jgi:hypothetical protein
MTTELIKPNTHLPAEMADRFAALRAAAAHAVETWHPAEGECLLGELIGHQRASGVYGENTQILVKDESGNITAAWFTQWLKENLRAQGAEQGDLIALTFLGKKTSPAGRIYNGYSLIVENPELG